MARRTRFYKYSRRTSSQKRGNRVWLIVLACVSFILLSVVLSVAVGLALGERAQDFEGSEQKLDVSVKEHYSGNKKVKNINAVAYQWGFGTSHYISQGINDFSVCLRDGDGFITYHSEVDVAIGGETDMGSRKLSLAVGDIRDEGGYVCGYIYSGAFSESDPYMREIKKAYELALVREAAEGGVNDILLVGIGVGKEGVEELEDFLCRAARAAGDATLGILIDPDTVKKDENTVKRLAAACDFLALDLRDLSKRADLAESEDRPGELYSTLDSMKYFVKVYSMRIVFSSTNERLREAALKLGVTSVQVIE